MPSIRSIFSALCVAVLTLAVSGARAEAPNAPRPLKCVYFVPSDCEPIPDRAERLFRVMTRVQDFYRREMERNGFGPISFELEEEPQGKLKLYEVRAPKKQEEYGRNSAWQVRDVVAEELAKQGIDVSKEVLVVFQLGLRWEDGKATEVASFVGAGSPFYGIAWVYDDPILDSENLASKAPGGWYGGPCSIGAFNTHYIGGIAHELGHALTLPHDGETAAERKTLGAALMGGGNHTFGREERGEGLGAFLTRSEALRLSVVPAISGQTPQRRPLDVKLVELRPTRIDQNAVKFVGKIETDAPVKGIIFYDDPDSRAADYDAKTWTTEPDQDGNFEIVLTEVAAEPSSLRVVVVRDVDSVAVLNLAIKPDGTEKEFEPIQNAIFLQKVGDAFAARDCDALEALAKTEGGAQDANAALCDALVKRLREPAKLEAPKDVDDDLARFDLANANFDVAKVGWARLGRGAAYDGSLLAANGVGYSSGLFAHAPSVLRAELGKRWKRFDFSCGLNAGSTGSVVFVVRGDGRELYRSEVLRKGTLQSGSIDVSDVQTLELATEDGGDGVTSDHSVWFNPTLSR